MLYLLQYRSSLFISVICSYLAIWGGLYVLLKNGLLPMDSLVDILEKTPYTSKAIGLVTKYPNVRQTK